MSILDENGHAGVGVVDGAEAGQKGHDGDADDAHAADALLNGEDAVLGAEYGKRVADLPEQRQNQQPDDHRHQESGPLQTDLQKS